MIPVGTQKISTAERSMLNYFRDVLRYCPYNKLIIICDMALDWKNPSNTYVNILTYIRALPENKVKEITEELNQWLM